MPPLGAPAQRDVDHGLQRVDDVGHAEHLHAAVVVRDPDRHLVGPVRRAGVDEEAHDPLAQRGIEGGNLGLAEREDHHHTLRVLGRGDVDLGVAGLDAIHPQPRAAGREGLQVAAADEGLALGLLLGLGLALDLVLGVRLLALQDEERGLLAHHLVVERELDDLLLLVGERLQGGDFERRPAPRHVLLRRGRGHRDAQIEGPIAHLAVELDRGGRGPVGGRADEGDEIVALEQRVDGERRQGAPLAHVDREVGERGGLARVGELDGEARGRGGRARAGGPAAVDGGEVGEQLGPDLGAEEQRVERRLAEGLGGQAVERGRVGLAPGRRAVADVDDLDLGLGIVRARLAREAPGVAQGRAEVAGAVGLDALDEVDSRPRAPPRSRGPSPRAWSVWPTSAATTTKRSRGPSSPSSAPRASRASGRLSSVLRNMSQTITTRRARGSPAGGSAARTSAQLGRTWTAV